MNDLRSSSLASSEQLAAERATCQALSLRLAEMEEAAVAAAAAAAAERENRRERGTEEEAPETAAPSNHGAEEGGGGMEPEVEMVLRARCEELEVKAAAASEQVGWFGWLVELVLFVCCFVCRLYHLSVCLSVSLRVFFCVPFCLSLGLTSG